MTEHTFTVKVAVPDDHVAADDRDWWTEMIGASCSAWGAGSTFTFPARRQVANTNGDIMTNARVETPTCTRIVVKSEQDPDSDPRDYVTEGSEEGPYDAEAIAGFEAGDWTFLGIFAVATVLVPMGPGSFVFELTGPGLWSVASSSMPDYQRQVGEEQTGELRSVLDALGVSHEGAEIEWGWGL